MAPATLSQLAIKLLRVGGVDETGSSSAAVWLAFGNWSAACGSAHVSCVAAPISNGDTLGTRFCPEKLISLATTASTPQRKAKRFVRKTVVKGAQNAIR